MMIRVNKFLFNCSAMFLGTLLSVAAIADDVQLLESANDTVVRLPYGYDSMHDMSLTTDNRIRQYIYSPNNIYMLVLHYGFQSHIEFAPHEEIRTISLGDTYAWTITPLENRLFIKPLEKNLRTNMTIITNKRTYQFDLISMTLEDDDAEDLVYVVRFIYPKKKIRKCE